MELFWKALAGILIAAILSITLKQDMALLLSLAVCAMGAMILLEYLEPVLDLLRRLEAMADLQSDMLRVLLKALGLALVSELTSLICADTGNAALGKIIRMLTNAAILWLSVPVLQSVLEVLQKIVEEI